MRDSKKKWALVLGLVLVLMAVLAQRFLYPAPRDIARERVEFEMSARALSEAMSQMESTPPYANRVVLTWGKIVEIRGRRIVLEHGVEALMLDPVENVGVGDKVTIKARCVGYDELLEAVRLDQASMVPNDTDR